MPYVLGLMGWFASGKSKAAQFLTQRGFFEIDVDLVGKEALKECQNQIVSTFGQGVLKDLAHSSIICPKKLGNIVFEDPKELLKLNLIVHPWIKKRVEEIILTCKKDKILINAAILPQIGLAPLCDCILMIHASQNKIIKRGIKRNGFSAQKIKFILLNQKKYNDYFKTADVIIKNNNSLLKFYQKLKKFVKNIGGINHDASGRKSRI